jgi:glyoxylase-like metal-dependent hydrolase (beta-lactamase superfamily II)
VGGEGRVFFRQLARPETGCLAYLVGDPVAGEAIAVDPPEDPTPLVAEASAAGMRIVGVVETHTHADHRSGARRLAEGAQAPLWLPEKSGAAFAHSAYGDGATLRAGSLRVAAIHTPGHTPDAMTLVLGDRALVGDTLLVGSPGRADFYDKGPEELYHSIFDKLLQLEDEIVLYPAHYGPRHGLPDALMTTLGQEKRVDEALSLRNQHDFVRYMTEGWPPKPAHWEAIVAANNGL